MLPTLQLDEKEMKKQLRKEQDIICMDNNAYIGYLLVATQRMNPFSVKAKIVKWF